MTHLRALGFAVALLCGHVASAAGLHDMAQMTVSGTPGTGTISLGSATAGFQAFVSAGVVNGETITYYIKDGASSWEVGHGVYTSSGTTLTRGPIFSSNGNAAINASSASIVTISSLVEDTYPQGFNTIDVSAQPGADICSQISNAIDVLIATGAQSGTLDARGFGKNNYSSATPYACATPPYTKTINNNTIGLYSTTLILPLAAIATDQTWVVPTNQRVECADRNVHAVSPTYGCVVRASNNFPNFSVNPTLTTGTPTTVVFTTSSNAFEGMLIQFRSNSDTLGTGLFFNEFYHLHFTVGPGTNGGGTNTAGTCSVSCTAELWQSFDPIVSPNTVQRMVSSGSPSGTHVMVSTVPVMQRGRDCYQHGSGSCADDFSISLQNITLNCQTPNGTFPTGNLGLFAVQGEENSKIEGLWVFNCIDNFGIWYGGGAGSRNILQDWSVAVNGTSSNVTSNFGCLAVANANTASYNNGLRNALSTLNGFNCTLVANTASALTITRTVLIDGGDFGIENSYGEIGNNLAGTVTITTYWDLGATYGNQSGCGGILLRNILNGQSSGTVVVTTSVNDHCIHGNMHIENMYPFGTSGNTLYTDNSGTCSATFNPSPAASPQDDRIAFYVRRADGSGTTNRRSQFKFGSAMCTEIAP